MKELLNEIDGLQDGSLMAHADGSVNKVNKETREKTEEIVNKKLAYCPVEGNSDIYRVHRYRVEELKGEISTLIQEERKDLEKYLAKVIKQLEEEEKELCKAFRKIDDLEIRLKIERKEAVRGLIEYLEVNTEKVFYLGCGKMINEYLGIVESEGKE